MADVTDNYEARRTVLQKMSVMVAANQPVILDANDVAVLHATYVAMSNLNTAVARAK